MRRRGYLWCSARTERAANCRDVRTCKSAVEKRNCKCMGRTRERKLKFVCKIAKIDRGSLCDFTVAPHAGAWVEIVWRRSKPPPRAVAPHAGAWVEIPAPSPPPWWVRSPPTRGRGLKYVLVNDSEYVSESPPTRGRGLKCPSIYHCRNLLEVAPHAGAWVEIIFRPPVGRGFRQSPPTRGRGLKCGDPGAMPGGCWSPPTRGRGLKSSGGRPGPLRGGVAPPRGGCVAHQNVVRWTRKNTSSEEEPQR